MSDPTPQQVDWYIKFYNSQPKKLCPCCNEPMFARTNDQGEVVIDLEHKPDCTLHTEYKAFADAHPDLSPGMLFLAWNHRND